MPFGSTPAGARESTRGLRDSMKAGRAADAFRKRSWWILGSVSLVAFVFTLHQTRGQTFFGDEFGLFMTRPALNLDALFQPQNGHLVAVPILIYRTVLALGGADSYLALRILSAALQVVAVVLLFGLLRRWLPISTAIAASTLMLFFGAGWEVVATPYGLFTLLAVTSGLGALLSLDRRSRTWDLVACALLIFSVSSLGVGLPFVVGSAALIWLRGPESRLRASWVVAIPTVLYILWMLRYSAESDFQAENLIQAPKFVLDG